MKKHLLAFSFLLMLLATLAFPIGGQAAANKSGGQIVFVNCRTFYKKLIASDCGLSIVNADGSGLRQVTDGVDDKMPALSPDGKKVAFSSMQRDGNFEIYVVNTDGTGLTRLTNRVEDDVSPEWSPDGTKIVFAGSLEGGEPYKRYIFLMNADGSGLKQLTKGTGFAPVWANDGKKIYYVTSRQSVNDIMSIRPDGTGIMGVKAVNALSVDPAVISPDGNMIAFISQKDPSTPIEIYITTAAQSWNDLTLITSGYNPIFGGLSWSPDGRQLIFTMHGDGKVQKVAGQLYLVNADGSDLKPFPVECLYCFGADWGASAE
jgi:TolB protein